MDTEEFSYKTCPLYLIEFDLEEAKANRRFAKENLRNINDQLTYTMPMLSSFEREHNLKHLEPYQLAYYLRTKSDAESLVSAKLGSEREIKQLTAKIKRLKSTLKGRGVA